MRSFIVFIIMLYTQITFAGQITLNVKNASLPDVIRFMAASAGLNVLVSPMVTGTVSLALDHASVENALNILLESQGLSKWTMGHVWYVATKAELIKRKEEELKWREAYNEAEPLVTEMIKIRYAKADDILQILKNQQTGFFSKRGVVHVDSRTNTLLMQDVATSIASIRKLIAKLDVPVKQIMLEAKLASVDTNFEQEIGVDFSNASPQAVQRPGRYSIAVVKLPDESQLNIKLSALQRSGHAELISSPRLFTANQQAAYIESGEEVPYQEVSESGGTAVVFKKAVLGLNVTPQVMPGNRVLLQIKLNQDRPAARMVQGVPTISTRQMLTSVMVANGETVVLGGIYESSDENDQEGLPYLSEIPYLGALFRTNNMRHNKRELLVFVTPKVIG